MIKISTPVPGYNGIDCGIRFENGLGIVEKLPKHIIEWFRVQGYIVEEDEVVVEAPVVINESNKEPENDNNENVGGNKDEDPKNEESDNEKTKAELLEEAKVLGIENIRSKATKAEIEQLINDKKIELEALAGNGDSDNGDSGDEDLKDKEPENEDPEKGE